MGPGKCDRKEKVGPSRGGGGRGSELGEALWLLRFSGIVKQEAERRKEPGRKKIPESWRLTAKCLEIPQEVKQEEEGMEKVKMESSSTQGRSCRPRGPSGWASPRLIPSQPSSPEAGPSPWLRIRSLRLGGAVHEGPTLLPLRRGQAPSDSVRRGAKAASQH